MSSPSISVFQPGFIQSLRYIVTTQAPPSPTLCCSPSRAPSTCRFSAFPVSCHTSSAHCASPVAPSGWPFDRSPPEGFTTHLPPYVTWSSSISRPPSPSLQRPSDSYVTSSFVLKQSCSSITCTSFGPSPACS